MLNVALLNVVTLNVAMPIKHFAQLLAAQNCEIAQSYRPRKWTLGSPVACRKVPETMTFPVQLTDVAKAMALPLLEAGKISLRRIQTIGPKLQHGTFITLISNLDEG